MIPWTIEALLELLALGNVFWLKTGDPEGDARYQHLPKGGTVYNEQSLPPALEGAALIVRKNRRRSKRPKSRTLKAQEAAGAAKRKARARRRSKIAKATRRAQRK